MIPFIDLKTQYARLKPDILKRIEEVLDHGQYIMGPEIAELENLLAKYVGVKHCIAVSSGTDALLLPLMAIGLKPGDEVILPDFSFFATAEVVELLGGVCRFIDIDPDSYNLDPKKLEAAITSKTKAIIAVSLYGKCADFTAINAVAEKHNILVIEDGAQSFGATHRGKKSCGLSTVGATSFFPSKPLGGYGDSGACFTNDDKLATLMKEMRVHGQRTRYNHTSIGINARMDTLQAAILIEKLKVFDEELVLRRKIAEKYNKSLKNFRFPHLDNEVHAMAQYTIECDQREKLVTFLNERGIPTAVHYPGTLSEQPVLKEKYPGVKNEFSFAAARKVLSLPMSPYLNEEDQEKIINAINSFNG